MTYHDRQPRLTDLNFNPNLLEDYNVMFNKWNMPLATGFKLERQYDYSIRDCFIIGGYNDSDTIESVKNFGLNCSVEESFNVLDNLAKLSGKNEYDGVVVKNIIAPPKHKNAEWLNHIKLSNIMLTYRQVTRLLNHIAIWEQCIRNQRPVIVLEAGVKLYLEHTNHLPRNSIISLDSGLNQFFRYNENFVSMNNPHAYSIDHFVAKRLFNDVMKNGLVEPLERHFRIDKYLVIPENRACGQTS